MRDAAGVLELPADDRFEADARSLGRGESVWWSTRIAPKKLGRALASAACDFRVRSARTRRGRREREVAETPEGLGARARGGVGGAPGRRPRSAALRPAPGRPAALVGLCRAALPLCDVLRGSATCPGVRSIPVLWGFSPALLPTAALTATRLAVAPLPTLVFPLSCADLVSVRENAKREERERRELAAELARIEAEAKAAYERDLAAGDAKEVEGGRAAAGGIVGPTTGPSVGPLTASEAAGAGRASEPSSQRPTFAAPAAAPTGPATSVSSPSNASLGSWELREGTQGYYYNAVQRYYYDEPSGMYYGGDPPDWTETPAIPEAAQFEVMRREKEAEDARASAATSRAAADGNTTGVFAANRQPHTNASTVPSAGGLGARPATSATVASSSRPGAPSLVTQAAARPSNANPLSQVGGYSMPSVGQIGGAKGLGSSEQIRAQKKRYRELKDVAEGKKLPPGLDDPTLPEEERTARVRREAARARVLLRTMDTFGLR